MRGWLKLSGNVELESHDVVGVDATNPQAVVVYLVGQTPLKLGAVESAEFLRIWNGKEWADDRRSFPRELP